MGRAGSNPRHMDFQSQRNRDFRLENELYVEPRYAEIHWRTTGTGVGHRPSVVWPDWRHNSRRIHRGMLVCPAVMSDFTRGFCSKNGLSKSARRTFHATTSSASHCLWKFERIG